MEDLGQSLIDALLGALPALMAAATNALAQLTTDRGRDLWGQIGSSLQSSDVNFLTRTPAALSYNLGGVADLYAQFEPIMLGAVALSCVCAGLAVVGREYFHWSWQPGEWAARVFLGVLLGLSTPRIYAWSINLMNAICDAIVGAPLPSAPTVEMDPWAMAVLIVVWLVLGIRLLVRMGYRLIYLDVLLVLGPLGMASIVIPGAYEYHLVWRRAFIGMLLGQLLVTLCLRLATQIVGPLGGSWGGVAVSAAVLMVAYDMVTVLAPIRGGGLFGMAKSTVSTVGKAAALL